MAETPLLSVCIPTHNRPELLRRTLGSIRVSKPEWIEVIVSDNSGNDDSKAVVEQALAQAPFRWTYYRNDPDSGGTENTNQCIEIASGKYIYIIHDDDFLYPDGLDQMCECLLSFNDLYKVLKFGVWLVDIDGKPFRKQTCREEIYLKPEEAYLKLLNNSSWIRFPSMVVAKSAYDEWGMYDPAYKGADDFDMWIRLIGQYGVYCTPEVVAAFTIHQEADTQQMFNPEMIDILLNLFDKAEAKKLLRKSDFNRSKANFFNQFILSGTMRSLRRKDMGSAKRIMGMFNMEPIRNLEISYKWLFLKLLFNLLSYERTNFTKRKLFGKSFKSLSN